MSTKVKIQSRKFLKPSNPTPPTLRYYKIGFIDELAPKENVSIVLFFRDYNKKSVLHLEESLEKTLTLMYPLAGRYMKDIHTVDCTDQGVEFIQALANITLHEYIHPPFDPHFVNEFIPLSVWAADEATDTILGAQVTTFVCGGVALGISISHRIADASTLCTFLNQWAALSRRDNEVEFFGLGFNSSSFFPPRGLHSLDHLEPFDNLLKNNHIFVTKRLLFSKSAISNMKAKFMRNGKISYKLSKVQVISAVIWKALIGVDCAVQGYLRDSIIIQPMNLREKTKSPKIPKHTCGNVFGLIKTIFNASEMSMEFEELANLLVKSVKKTIQDYSKICHESNEGQMMIWNSFPRPGNCSNIANAIIISSWCKLPFYESDFGFGKPIHLGLGSIPIKRSVYLVDDEGGDGVEAYVHLGVEEVSYFENDVDIKAFAA